MRDVDDISDGLRTDPDRRRSEFTPCSALGPMASIPSMSERFNKQQSGSDLARLMPCFGS